MKNQLDERQEQTLLHIESMGFWLAYWGLLAAMVVQVLLGRSASAWGEFVVFMVLCVYALVRCLRNGIWDRRLKPNLKTNLAVSAVAGVSVGIVLFLMAYLDAGAMRVALVFGLVGAPVTFGLTLTVLTLCARAYQKRVQKLEEEE